MKLSGLRPLSFGIATAFGVAGCRAGQVRSAYSAEFDCPESKVSVHEVGVDRFRAEGCNKSVVYECLASSCIPEASDELADDPPPQRTETYSHETSNSARRKSARGGKAIVAAEIPLGGRALLKLWSMPGERSQLMLILAEDEPDLLKCSIQVMVNGELLATPAPKTSRKGIVSALISDITPEFIRELWAAKQLALRACEHRWSLDPEQLYKVHHFAALHEEELAWVRDPKKATSGGFLAPSGGWPPWKSPGAAPGAAAGAALEAQALFERVSPSILTVEVLSDNGSAQGSAVAVSPIEALTNCHVLEGARKVILKQGKKEWVAQIGRSEPKSDRCVLVLSDPVLKPIVGTRAYADLKVGEALYTLGSPNGLDLTLANGILSGLREEKGQKFIQTTAPISPGSSGGGLFDARGNLVGITTMVLAGKERLNQSLNFAIPAEAFWQP